jgi:hypothetical protein
MHGANIKKALDVCVFALFGGPIKNNFFKKCKLESVHT